VRKGNNRQATYFLPKRGRVRTAEGGDRQGRGARATKGKPVNPWRALGVQGTHIGRSQWFLVRMRADIAGLEPDPADEAARLETLKRTLSLREHPFSDTNTVLTRLSEASVC